MRLFRARGGGKHAPTWRHLLHHTATTINFNSTWHIPRLLVRLRFTLLLVKWQVHNCELTVGSGYTRHPSAIGNVDTTDTFALCCHSNATRAPIANPPNSAQLGGIPYHSPKLHPGPCNSVGIRPQTGTQSDTHTQTRVTTIRFALSTTRAKCNNVMSNNDVTIQSRRLTDVNRFVY